MSDSRPRPYRSRKQKPCNVCRKRKICCIRTGDGPCQLCDLRNVECVVENETSVSRALKSVHTTEPSQAHQSVDYSSNSTVLSEQPRAPSFVGLSGDFDPFILRHKQWPNHEPRSSTSLKCERVGKAPLFPVYFTSSPGIYRLAERSSYSVKDLLKNKQEILVRAYFEHVHSTFPLLATREQEIILGTHELLTLSLCFIAKPFCPSSSEIDEESLAAYIYTSLVEKASYPTLETVEAFLVFSQRHGYSERFPGSPGNSLEAGIVVTMAHNLGLNINSSTWDIPYSEKKRRKRLWWAVYVLDKWSAMALGRPSLIDDSQMDVEPLFESDFMDHDCQGGETNVPLQYRTFTSMASLSIVLSDVLQTFYTIRAKQNWVEYRSPERLFGEYSRLERLLRSWEEESLTPLLPVRAYPDPLGSILLAYHTLRAILCRAVLLKLERLETEASLIIDKAFAVSSDTISFVQSLTMSQMSAFWWPFSHASFSIIGSFMLSRFLSSTQPENSERWANQFSEYHKLLQAYSSVFPVVRYAESSLRSLSE